MKRYIKELRNDMIRTYPGIDKEKVDRAIKAYDRGLITITELLRAIINLAEEAR